MAAAAYLKSVDRHGKCYTGLIASKARLSPWSRYTIPRLELCYAVMAVNLSEVTASEIDIHFTTITFYTDSKIVLGYIYNEKWRFYVFVHDRVQKIRRSTLPQYVDTEHNPARPV